MARKKEEPKPFFPLKHEFVDSLDRFIHTANMLALAVRNVIQLKGCNHVAAQLLSERLAAFSKARFGDEGEETIGEEPT
jgi:hypothetical protein